MNKIDLSSDVAAKNGASVDMNSPATRGYPPIPPEVEAGLLGYLSDNCGRCVDSQSIGPERLIAGLPHGPFTEAALTTDPFTGSPCVAFKVRNEALQRRYVPHEAFLILRLHLCRGGGCSVNDSSKRWCEEPKRGYGYVVLFGGNDKIGLMRLLLDTGLGDMAMQHGPDGELGDYHSHDPRFMVKGGFEVDGAKGRKRKVPSRGRREAVAAALKAFDRTKSRSKSPLTREAFEAALWQSFELYDVVNRQA